MYESTKPITAGKLHWSEKDYPEQQLEKNSKAALSFTLVHKYCSCVLPPYIDEAGSNIQVIKLIGGKPVSKIYNRFTTCILSKYFNGISIQQINIT
jgi:hypothetical protein